MQPFVVSLVSLATCCSQLIRMSPTWEQCLEYVPSSADVAFDLEHEKASLVSGFFFFFFVCFCCCPREWQEWRQKRLSRLAVKKVEESLSIT